MVEKGCIWRDWDTIVAISLFISVNTRLQSLSKKIAGYDHHKTFPRMLMNCLYQFNEAGKHFNFFKKVAEYRCFVPVIFKHQRKKLDSPIKTKLSHKMLYPSKLVQYLGIKIDENLNWKQHIHDDIAIKLNRTNAYYYIQSEILLINIFYKNHLLCHIWYSINYANLYGSKILMLWVELLYPKRKPYKLWIFSLLRLSPHYSNPSSHILKPEDKILIENIVCSKQIMQKSSFSNL